MNLLYYNALDTKKVKQAFKKTEQLLKKQDFKSADVQKIADTDFYHAKLDNTHRLLFKIAKYQNENYLLLLEVIAHKAYEQSRFLKGETIESSQIKQIHHIEKVAVEDVHQMVYVNKKNTNFHVLDKIISLDDEQNEIYGLSTPLIIIGSAGSGKTALTLEKVKHLRGNVAYISLSSFLVENAQTIYYANNFDNEKQEVDFLSFTEYLQSIQLPQGKEINFRAFDQWFSRYKQSVKIKESYKLFEEFKGVLTGSIIDKPYLSKEDYLNLGVKQSIFLADERIKVYEIFEKYLTFLNEGKYYDSNIVAFHSLAKVAPKYDYVVVDEVQDLTNIQLMLILKSIKSSKNQGNNFILSGDSNQIVHPNFFSWSQLKSMFFKTNLQGTILRILKTNYRNSQQVTQLSNNLLKIKNARFGSIDRESTYLIETVSESKGEVAFFQDNDKIKKELNEKTQSSAKYAILVMNNDDKYKAKKYFNTPLIFSIQEAKGLEYENIILINFIADYDKEFKEISQGVTRQDLLEQELKYSRGKDKTNKELEAFKFYINSLYVAITRAVKNLYIIEGVRKHPLLDLLQLKPTKEKLNIKQQFSNEEEWLKEAKRLEMQGKFEQAQQIRDRIKGIKHISQEQVEKLIEQAFAPNFGAGAQKELFEFAKNRNQFELIERLAKECNLKIAKSYLNTFTAEQKRFLKSIKSGKYKQVIELLDKYGVGFKTTDGDTALTAAARFGKTDWIKKLLEKGIKKATVNKEGLTAQQVTLQAFDREDISEAQLKKMYPLLMVSAVKVKTKERIIKINPRSMEYFLINYVKAVFDDVIEDKKHHESKGMTMDDFMLTIEYMPEVILKAYRRKRQYVNSILAKNEVNREDPYNRLLFKRIDRGTYIFNPNMTLIFE